MFLKNLHSFRYKYSFAFIIFIIVTILGVMQVLFISLPFNPVKASMSSEKLVLMAVPQGWAFFTRNAREAQVILYRAEEGSVTPMIHQHSSVYNFFGLKRASTRILTEMQVLRDQLEDNQFENTKWNYQKNLHGSIPDTVHPVKNIMQDPILCGDFVLVFQEHVPWAWASSMEEIMMPAKIIKIRVSCE